MSEPKQPESPVDAAPEKFYLTTPIYYVNARPHIGHAYSTIVADVLARRHRLLGHDTFFLTGTDEHGQKIERSAAAAGVPPQQFADQVSKTFSDLWQRMGITNDAFIRTTDPRHKRGVQQLFETLYEQGHIYLSTYTGQYSIGEEMFVDGPPGTIGPDGRPTETVTEENFFFRLSAFQKPLLDLIESNALKITPESSRNEVLSFIRGDMSHLEFRNLLDSEVKPQTDSVEGKERERSQVAEQSERVEKIVTAFMQRRPDALKDLSISRSSFTWGIPVPQLVQEQANATKDHVIYVWLDALANYMTAIGYGSTDEGDHNTFSHLWPADLHIVGKEITRFHCVYWPAFLLALNPKLNHELDQPMPALARQEHVDWAAKWLPSAVTANGWLLFDDSKMSKSKGNVVRTETILDTFGEHLYKKQFGNSTKQEQDIFASDVLRYYLIREITFGQDGSFTFDSLVTRYNADLANGYGNLVSRVLKMIQSDYAGVVPIIGMNHIVESVHRQDEMVAYGTQGIADLAEITIRSTLEKSQLDRNLLFQFDFFRYSVDAYLTWNAPWKMKRDVPEEEDRRKEILYTAAESIRILSALLYPIIPYATARVWAQLGLGSIEAAAADGYLKNLQWGGLKPGTKLGLLTPIFPRADKSLVTIMEDLEAANIKSEKAPAMPTEDTSQQPAEPATHPAEPLKEHGDPMPVADPKEDSTHPGAPPRTSSQETSSPGATVAGSHAITTEREGTPSHTEAQASGIFSSTAGGGQPETPQIAIDDFTKIDLRVAKIVVAERIPKADKLLRLEVDLGYEQRQILSGIAEHYTPEELIGRKIVIIANLAPRKMRGLESRGMLLAASEGEHGKPILATFGEEIAVGTRLR